MGSHKKPLVVKSCHNHRWHTGANVCQSIMKGGDIMSTYGYEANKKYRRKYPKKYLDTKKKYYRKFAGPNKNQNHGQDWTTRELILINSGLFSDRVLHKIIGRSVCAIQTMRSIIKTKKGEEVIL